MNMHPDLVGTLVAQRQGDLLHEAAERRLVREFRRPRGAHRRGRLGRRKATRVPDDFDLVA